MEAIDDSSKSELCWYFVSTNCLAQRVAIEEFYHEYFLIFEEKMHKKIPFS